MCDRNGRGTVDRTEFVSFLRSLKLAAGVSIELQLQDNVIEQMLQRAGIAANQTLLTHKDFEAIFGNVHDVGVHMRGARLKINLQECENPLILRDASEKVRLERKVSTVSRCRRTNGRVGGQTGCRRRCRWWRTIGSTSPFSPFSSCSTDSSSSSVFGVRASHKFFQNRNSLSIAR
jgi:hypothetical protein